MVAAAKSQNKPEKKAPANDAEGSANVYTVSPKSRELVVGLVGYAGAGTSTAGHRIHVLLEAAGYKVEAIKFSDLIAVLDGLPAPEAKEGIEKGRSRFERAANFQDRGDQIRLNSGGYALASAAIKEIKRLRGDQSAGANKTAYILDSLKHPEEVDLLRRVYDHTFRLVAVHCNLPRRQERLIGENTSEAKYGGVPSSEVFEFMDRDGKDSAKKHGQRVRDVFHLADFFLDNSMSSHGGSGMNDDIDRFVNLLLGNGLVRPTAGEKAMYVAHSSALQSACLSRQVGAALISADGRLVATGKNDPPKFGGGTYDEDSESDHRCFKWKFDEESGEFVGCHNDRKKDQLRKAIADWLASQIAPKIAKKVLPVDIVLGDDVNKGKRQSLSDAVSSAILELPDAFAEMPGIRDAIEYSRSIHAEMAALMAASRGGISTKSSTLYVTVFPCHNCARHLVAAGVEAVYFIEPYVKSLAYELHSDSITEEVLEESSLTQKRMTVAPFTGVGPRMYDDFFVKRKELKGARGRFDPKDEGEPYFAVRLRELNNVEDAAVGLVPDLK